MDCDDNLNESPVIKISALGCFITASVFLLNCEFFYVSIKKQENKTKQRNKETKNIFSILRRYRQIIKIHYSLRRERVGM